MNYSHDPNCSSETLFWNNKNHVVIRSIKEIPALEELTYDYRLSYTKHEQLDECYCSSKNCTGYMIKKEDLCCYTCNEKGHKSKNCPQYEIFIIKSADYKKTHTCSRCRRKGHWKPDCIKLPNKFKRSKEKINGKSA